VDRIDSRARRSSRTADDNAKNQSRFRHEEPGVGFVSRQSTSTNRHIVRRSSGGSGDFNEVRDGKNEDYYSERRRRSRRHRLAHLDRKPNRDVLFRRQRSTCGQNGLAHPAAGTGGPTPTEGDGRAAARRRPPLGSAVRNRRWSQRRGDEPAAALGRLSIDIESSSSSLPAVADMETEENSLPTVAAAAADEVAELIDTGNDSQSSTAASEATSSSSSSTSVSAAAAAAAAVAASDPQSGDEAAPGAAAAAPAQDLEFVYADADEYSVEIAELYTYTEEADLRANQVAFDQLFDESKQQHRWTKLDDPSRRAFIERLLNMLDLGGGGVGSEDRRKTPVGSSSPAVHCAGRQLSRQKSGSAGGQSGPGGSGSNITLNDSTELRLMLSLLYNSTIIANYKLKHFSPREPIVGEDCLAITPIQHEYQVFAVQRRAPHYPDAKGDYCLLWKVVLVLNHWPAAELHKRKNELKRHGLAPVTERELPRVAAGRRASSPPMSAADMFDQMPRRS
uniref:N1221 domain-containing protein n=1 Tax=Macrostomum lignano TaxID=282301 RepID=A0A1I8JQX9_9PLAT